MQQTQVFKRNSFIEDLFSLSSKCIALCKTINRANLNFDEIRCLENCGYNKTFLGLHMKELLESATWGEETSGFEALQ